MILTSTAFVEGGMIPHRFTADGENVSPQFRWARAPQETKSFVLTCMDETALGLSRYHWVAYDIPAYHVELGEGAGQPGGFEDFRHAVNDFNHFGYGGPRQTSRPGMHHYCFSLYALDCASLTVRTHPSCEELLKEARQHTLAVASIVGAYEWR